VKSAVSGGKLRLVVDSGLGALWGEQGGERGSEREREGAEAGELRRD